MYKRWLFILFVLLGGISLLFFKKPAKAPAEYCAFCNSVVLNAQTFYEDELVLALYTHKPIFPGHCLIIPKRHVERFEMLSDAEIAQMGEVIKKVDLAVTKVFGTCSYFLHQKNGREAGQTVPHVHFHYVCRKAGDDSGLKYVIKSYITNAKKPIPSAEMASVVGKMKEAMESL